MLLVLTEKCSGCGTCISKCQKKALIMTHNNGQFKNLKKVVVNNELCNNCGECITSCRYSALILE